MPVSSIPTKPAPKKEPNKPFGKIEKGGFHKWLGKKPGQPLTDADIEKGLKSSDPHVHRMAVFAKNARDGKFKHSKKDKQGKPAHECVYDNPPAWLGW